MSISDIIMFKVQKREVTVYTTHSPISSNKPLKYWLDTINSPYFFQPHKSFIINLQHVLSFDKGNIYLFGNLCAYLTSRKQNDFKDKMLQILNILK